MKLDFLASKLVDEILQDKLQLTDYEPVVVISSTIEELTNSSEDSLEDVFKERLLKSMEEENIPKIRPKSVEISDWKFRSSGECSKVIKLHY